MECNKIEIGLPKALRETEEAEPHRFSFRASSAGACPKFADLCLQEKIDLQYDADSVLRFKVGKHLHLMWQELMVSILGDDFIHVEEEVSITTEGGTVITGHPDGAIQSMRAIWELKNVADSTFTMIKNSGQPIEEHVYQGHIYCKALGLDSILIQYFNKNSNERLFFTVPFMPQIMAHIEQFYDQRAANLKLGVVADRPFHDPTQYPCCFCPNKTSCYENFKEEVRAMDVMVIDEPHPIAQWVRGADYSRTTRLDADKSEQEAKSEISKALLAANKNGALVRGKDKVFDVSIKIGKNGNPLVTIKGVRQ